MSYMRDLDGYRLDQTPVKVYALSGVELAYAENSTGVPLTIPISAVASAIIPGCLVTVPANAAPVWLHYSAEVSIASTGGGLISIEVWDVTTVGSEVQVHDTSFGNVTSQAILYSGLGQTVVGAHRLEPSATDRLFQLKTLMFRDSASTLTAAVLNSTRTGAPYGYSYISAVQK